MNAKDGLDAELLAARAQAAWFTARVTAGG
jgi:hypothetical protein